MKNVFLFIKDLLEILYYIVGIFGISTIAWNLKDKYEEVKENNLKKIEAYNSFILKLKELINKDQLQKCSLNVDIASILKKEIDPKKQDKYNNIVELINSEGDEIDKIYKELNGIAAFIISSEKIKNDITVFQNFFSLTIVRVIEQNYFENELYEESMKLMCKIYKVKYKDLNRK